ncbi:MAG: pirin family protein [Woeseia sp.]
MSYVECTAPECSESSGSIELRVVPKEKDLGEMTVRRVLPSPNRKMVGPFIFFDHMGPAGFPPGKGINVRPHPHIGIATITYLFEGEIMHRDDLGFEQAIREGAVNLMTAGRGIVHSERAGSDLDMHAKLHGIQSWMALPDGKEEIEPAFEHIPAADLPDFEIDGVRIRIIMGEAYGKTSPVTTYSTTLYMECQLPKGASLSLPEQYTELGAYVVTGSVRIDGEQFESGVLAIARPGRAVQLTAEQDSRVMVIGGDTIGPRHIWWNFVSGSKERLEQAKRDWKEGQFGTVPGDDEFIPLPE